MSEPLPRLAVLADPREEDWPSMDVVADMLAAQLAGPLSSRVRAEIVVPPMASVATRVAPPRRRSVARNVDRLITRFGTYPARMLAARARFEFFHVADHTYAQLVHALPASRTGVYCHDVDAFRCLITPAADPRPAWFRAMSRVTLEGMRRARWVFYSTGAVRAEIESHGLVDPARLVHAPFGIADEFHPQRVGDDGSDAVLEPLGGRPYVLHVGSEIPRKRIDVLLRTFAALRARRPELMLVQQNARLTDAQRALVDELGLRDAVLQPPRLPRATVAGLYRRAALVLLPSEAEGFGFPLIEALACGAPVIASEIPVLREVGGDAALYCPVGDVEQWAACAARVLDDPDAAPSLSSRIERARRYSWRAHAETILGAYLQLDAARPRGYPPA